MVTMRFVVSGKSEKCNEISMIKKGLFVEDQADDTGKVGQEFQFRVKWRFFGHSFAVFT